MPLQRELIGLVERIHNHSRAVTLKRAEVHAPLHRFSKSIPGWPPTFKYLNGAEMNRQGGVVGPDLPVSPIFRRTSEAMFSHRTRSKPDARIAALARRLKYGANQEVCPTTTPY
jgi:hypothetical protein